METTANSGTTSTTQTPAKSATSVKQQVNSRLTVWMTGRISYSNQVLRKDNTPVLDKDNQPLFETEMIIPAVDQYSHPKHFVILSRSLLGRRNDDLTIEVELSPYVKKRGDMTFNELRLWAV